VLHRVEVARLWNVCIGCEVRVRWDGRGNTALAFAKGLVGFRTQKGAAGWPRFSMVCLLRVLVGVIGHCAR